MSNASSGEWQRTKLKETLNAVNNHQERLYNKNNEYGYKININHPYIKEQWEKFKKLWDAGKIETGKPLYDNVSRRLEFETFIKDNKWFRKKLNRERSYYGNDMRNFTQMYE